VKHVGRRHPHGIDVGCGDGLGPVGGRAREAEVAHGPLATVGLGVGTDDELGIKDTIGEERGDTQHGARVRLAHPAQSEYGDADALHRILPAAEVIGSRGSVSVQVPRIQWWFGSSQKAIVRSSAGPASTFRKYIG